MESYAIALTLRSVVTHGLWGKGNSMGLILEARSPTLLFILLLDKRSVLHYFDNL